MRETVHEKVSRGLAIALGLMCYSREEEADAFISQLEVEKNWYGRFSATVAIAMAYVGTGNYKAVEKLLQVAVKDVKDDVRRMAVIALGFVMYGDLQGVKKTVGLLIESYNPHVRFGAAMALGIAGAGSSDSSIAQMILKLEDDKEEFVKQGVSISLAMVLMQATDKHNKEVDSFRQKLIEKIKKKKGGVVHKFGSILGLGILDAGGRNSVIKLRSESGTMKRGAVISMLLFTQFWYWFPLIQMISLSMEPTFLMGINKDLKMPKGFEFKSNVKKSTFDYPPLDADTKKKVNSQILNFKS